MKRPQTGRNRPAQFCGNGGFRLLSAWLVCAVIAVGGGGRVLATSNPTTNMGSGASSGVKRHAADEQAIRQQAAEYVRAFRKADTGSLAEMWAPDAVYVDDAGTVYKGREAIVDEMKAFFQKFGGQPLEVIGESIEFPADDIAIEHGITRLAGANARHAADRYTAVHVKRNGRWEMVRVSESPLRPPSGPERLRELGWLIGNWHVEGPNGTLVLKAEWVGNNNIIRCTFDTQGKDGSKTSQTQFIFWNPRKGKIWSWQYDWNGGYGAAWWERSGKAWIAHANSVEPDGRLGRANYIFRELDGDTFTWQSTSRRLSGKLLPDSAIIKVTRDKG